MSLEKWSDPAFLDRLASHGDALADETMTRLYEEHGIETVNQIFLAMRSDREAVPANAPAAFREFMEATADPPPGLDVDRLNHGGAAFCTRAFPASIVLLASSLPCGYSAPCLARVLTVSDKLGRHPYERLMGVLQLIVNVSSPVPTPGDERAHLTARRLRLLHAGIRYLVGRHRPELAERLGGLLNLEDMLATIMGFSYLVIEGLARFGVPMSSEEAEDYYYVWKIFALMMGIHPPGEPLSREFLPRSVAEAAAFYEVYCSRRYRSAPENPDGVHLAVSNLRMMEGLVPRPLRWMGLGYLPRLAMQELVGEEGMRRVGIRPVRGHAIARRTFDPVLRSVQSVYGTLSTRFGTRLTLRLFQRMIDEARGGEVRFEVPASLEAMCREF